jgi:hypothetical protein
MDAVVQVGQIPLSWTNLQPGAWVDVWYLDKTVSPDWTPVVTQQAVSDTTVGALLPGERAWRVDTYDGNPATDPNLIEGQTMYFYAVADQPPVLTTITAATASWANESTPLEVTLDDDGISEVKITWVAEKDGVIISDGTDPNVVFTTIETVVPLGAPSVALSVTTSVSCNYNAGQYTVTATALDSNAVGGVPTRSVNIYCASNPCAAARNGNGMDLAGYYIADINSDCTHDYADFADIGLQWQADYAITEAQEDNRE